MNGSSTLATSCEELTHWKRLWCLEGLGAGEGDDRGWDGWMASRTRWTWIWVNSGSWWWTGRPGMMRFMGSQRVGHDWATELNWTEIIWEAKYYSMVAQWLKRLPAMQEICVRSVGWQPTPVFLPGESHGERSLVGYSPWDHKELDTTERLHFQNYWRNYKPHYFQFKKYFQDNIKVAWCAYLFYLPRKNW